jgi:hypothetical protein
MEKHRRLRYTLIRCDSTKRILIIGEVFVDNHLDRRLIRLGGIFHGARTLNAIGAKYAAAYICPNYLNYDCELYFAKLAAETSQKIGEVTGAPNVVNIGDSAEAGDQLYKDVLGQRRKTVLAVQTLIDLVRNYQPTDILVVAGDYDLESIENACGSECRIYLDTDHWQGSNIAHVLPSSTIFSSTSGKVFEIANRDPKTVSEIFLLAGASTIILKENRGGSRGCIASQPGSTFSAPAFPVQTEHSVGVGDCFNAAWVASVEAELPNIRLRGCSYVASIYASSFDHNSFVNDLAAASRIRDDLLALRGVRIAWEDRPCLNIYLAAPDFPYNDTRIIDELERALAYHNFSPRRPVRENGMADDRMSPAQRRSLYYQDLQLLDDCAVLVAIPINADPGTFSELGWFAQSGRPTILFDPKNSVRNLFALNVATRTCVTLAGVIDSIFELIGAKIGER